LPILALGFEIADLLFKALTLIGFLVEFAEDTCLGFGCGLGSAVDWGIG
jgi:hypothetical protein